MNYRSLRIHDNVDYLLNVRAVDLAVVVHVGLLGSRAATDLNLHYGNIGVLAVILGSIDADGVCSSLSSIMYRTVDGELCYGIIYFGQPVTLMLLSQSNFFNFVFFDTLSEVSWFSSQFRLSNAVFFDTSSEVSLFQ